MKLSYKKSLLVLTTSLTLGLGACRKQLFQDPVNSLSPSAGFASADRIEKAAIGMYDLLQGPDWVNAHALIMVDVRSPDVNPPSYFNPLPGFTSVTSSEAYTNSAWQAGYRSIGEVNLFLKNLAAAGNIAGTDKTAQYNGEAKFIRALDYFYLVNMYAQPYVFTSGATHPGVPLILTSTDAPFDAANQVPRATVAAVYTQIENDLLEAETKLPLNYNDAAFQNVTRATKGAAQALLARVYLYEGKYAQASAYADKVIGGGNYALNGDPLTTYRTYTTKESIFSIANNGADNPNTNFALGQHYNPDQRGDIQLSPSYIALFGVNDLRLKNLILEQGGSYWTKKYTGVSDWTPILRYPEVLLIKAEALANTNVAVDATALALVNQVRARSKASAVIAASRSDLITLILTERRLELGLEGQGEFDYLRTKRDIPAHSVVPLMAYGSNYTILPIPRYDTDKNSNLVQNPGY